MQKTAYEMRISDWSSDVCSSDLPRLTGSEGGDGDSFGSPSRRRGRPWPPAPSLFAAGRADTKKGGAPCGGRPFVWSMPAASGGLGQRLLRLLDDRSEHGSLVHRERSEEHTSELQSLMRISYAVFCLKKNK